MTKKFRGPRIPAEPPFVAGKLLIRRAKAGAPSLVQVLALNAEAFAIAEGKIGKFFNKRPNARKPGTPLPATVVSGGGVGTGKKR